MKTRVLAMNVKTGETQSFDLGQKKAHEVAPILREIYQGFEIQGYKLTPQVRTVSIGGQRVVLFGFKG